MKEFRAIVLCGVAIVLSAVFSSSLAAATIFVDNQLAADITNGTYSISARNATGVDGNAYRTVKAAIAAMVAGDTCYVRGGSYFEIGINLAAKIDGSEARPYTISSYPGEWAVIDGRHASTASDQSVFTSSAAISYWRFIRLEITGGGNLSALPNYGAAIHLPAKHCLFQYLNIHDNYASTVNAGAAAGLMLLAGSQNNLIEYCWLKGNGNPTGDVNTANANLAIYSDYRYGNTVDIANASVQNEVRYNLFEGISATGWTPVGFVHKGFQRLTGYTHGETRNGADALPNDSSYRAFGDKIHHNIFLGHVQAIRADQDYVQIYNNIVDVSRNGTPAYSFRAIGTSDIPTDRRGSFWPSVYNNTVLANTGAGIILAILKGNWDCTIDGTLSDYSAGFAPNNLIDGAGSYYLYRGMSILMSESLAHCTSPQPHDLRKFQFSRNFFYANQDATNSFLVESSNPRTIAQMQVAGSLDVAWTKTNSSPYLGTTGGNKYKTAGSYQLDGSHAISNGGLGGNHPYLDVQIPSYVGAVDPYDSSWVDTVLGLSGMRTSTASGVRPLPPTGVTIK